MEHVCGAVEDDEAAVRLGGPQGWVRLWNRVVDPPPYGGLEFCIEVGAADMAARLHRVFVYNEAPDTFVVGLAESFAGWSGQRSWQSVNRDVTITAVFLSRGHVDMTWVLAPWRMNMDWRAEVTVRGIQAGEEMRSLAAGMGVLLG
ncbi:MAG TPA: DUF6228 family protein [Kutzneria sp.]